MGVDDRPNPDDLLTAVQREAKALKRGRLKVFVGMSPGVGKTYSMLEAAQREKAAGHDVLIGYLETHGRKETDALAQGLPCLPRKTYLHRGVQLAELDLEALLTRRPHLALVDELAHTNAPQAHHPKRWQDVQELLEAGIDVMTTVNVQHIESRADTVRQITGIEIRETVPDSLLDGAVLELVDLPPADLLRRLQEGKVYLPDRSAAAANHFFKEAPLTALRELSLRLVADHVGLDASQFRRLHARESAWKTNHCLMVAVGPSPLSEPLIRWTRRMADSLQCKWLAVHVERSGNLAPRSQAQLDKNLSIARELGAHVIATSDQDLVGGLLRVARQENVTQIVVGKPSLSNWLGWWRAERTVRRLMRGAGDIDLLVVRADKGQTIPEPLYFPDPHPGLKSYGIAIAVIGLTSVLNLGLMTLSGPRVPGLVFLLAVVLLALKVGRGPVLLAGASSALVWNYFFLPPRFTLRISQLEDGILFALYFVVAIVLGQLVSRIRIQEQDERRREERAVALYEFTRELTDALSRDAVVWQLIASVHRILKLSAGVAIATENDILTPHPDASYTYSEKELSVAAWALQHRKAAGRSTDNLPGAEAFHLPLFTSRKGFGVLSVPLSDRPLNLAQRDLLETFARQAALTLDRSELRAAAEQARLLASSEKMSRILLNSISHELRTPLAASTSAAYALSNAEAATPENRRMLIDEIVEANERLNRIVGNLLDVAKLEAGKVHARLDWHDALDLVQTTLRELKRELVSHPTSCQLPEGNHLVRIDYSLAQHALGNLILNAATHTPPGTPIELTVQLSPGMLQIQVGDRGPGIPPELLPRIFDKFYRAPEAPTGGSGLGLTIARGFIEIQGGQVIASNREGGGAVFTLRLPQPEKPPMMEAG